VTAGQRDAMCFNAIQNAVPAGCMSRQHDFLLKSRETSVNATRQVRLPWLIWPANIESLVRPCGALFTERPGPMSKRAIVINVSASHYNLGARKCQDWLLSQGYDSHYSDGDPGLWELDADLVALSCIFSWHAPLARTIALRMKDRAEIWAGGPGLFALANWWRKETGLDVVRGLDPRFDRQRGHYRMCFASRGCPVACSFCVAHLIEGREQTLDEGFVPAPILCDNNLSALPEASQQYIIDRYRAFGVPLLDANSGFEPRTFDEDTYQRWKPILRGVWRFALDETRELPDVERMMLHTSLSEESPRRKQVYCLIGNEPIEACYERACKILAYGGEPFCQFVLPLNWLGDPATLHPRFDWTFQAGKDFMRFFNRHLWRSFPIWDYRPRKAEPSPFAFLGSSKPIIALPEWAARPTVTDHQEFTP